MIRLFLTGLLLVLVSYTLQASETVKGAKKDIETFKKEMSVKLEAAEKNLQEIREKAKETGNTAKEKTAEGLGKSKAQLESELAGLKEDTKTGWELVKQKFAKAVDALNTKIQNAAK